MHVQALRACEAVMPCALLGSGAHHQETLLPPAAPLLLPLSYLSTPGRYDQQRDGLAAPETTSASLGA
jgi:hypothetical protein